MMPTTPESLTSQQLKKLTTEERILDTLKTIQSLVLDLQPLTDLLLPSSDGDGQGMTFRVLTLLTDVKNELATWQQERNDFDAWRKDSAARLDAITRLLEAQATQIDRMHGLICGPVD